MSKLATVTKKMIIMNNYQPSFSTGTAISTKEIITGSFIESTVDDIGRIYLATRNGLYDIKITRLNPDGTKDNTFGTSGEVFHAFNNLRDHAVESIHIKPNGKINIVSTAYNNATGKTPCSYSDERKWDQRQ